MTYGVYLSLEDLLDRMEDALRRKLPFSLVRIGDGENIVLAQDTVWPMEKVLEERWAIKANRGQKGLFLPNPKLRDAVAESIRKADAVGILPSGDESIKAPDYLKRALTDQVFAHYSIIPAVTCHACVNRELAVTPRFWNMLHNRRVLIVTEKAEEVREVLESAPYGLHIAHTLAFGRYEQMEETLCWIAASAGMFEVALFSCGVNAVVLAQRTAELTGTVAVDFGKAFNILRFGRAN